jgi:hypothetical protein
MFPFCRGFSSATEPEKLSKNIVLFMTFPFE